MGLLVIMFILWSFTVNRASDAVWLNGRVINSSNNAGEAVQMYCRAL
jgi:hypothetical protein